MEKKTKRKVTVYNPDGSLADLKDHNLIGKHVVIEGPYFTEEELEDSRRRTREFMKGFKSRYIDDDEELRKESGFGSEMNKTGRFDPDDLGYMAECMTCGMRFKDMDAVKRHAAEHDDMHTITIGPGEGRRREIRRKNILDFIGSEYHRLFDGPIEDFVESIEKEYLDGSIDGDEVYGLLVEAFEGDDMSVPEKVKDSWLRFFMSDHPKTDL